MPPVIHAEPARTRRPSFVELGGEYVSADVHGGRQSWSVRGADVVAVVGWAAAGEVVPVGGECAGGHAVVVPDGGEVGIAPRGGSPVRAVGPALAVLPAGDADVTVLRPGYLLHVRDRVPAADGAPGTVRVFPLGDGGERVYRAGSLLIRFPVPRAEADDARALHPALDDVEQVLVALLGDHVQHVRRPWTARLGDWRPDEHVRLMSPSVTLVPPGDVHVARAVGPGPHRLVIVSAPPRAGSAVGHRIRNDDTQETE